MVQGVTLDYDAWSTIRHKSDVGDSSGRRIECSSFDKPTKIATADHTTRFSYNPSRARYLRTDENA